MMMSLSVCLMNCMVVVKGLRVLWHLRHLRHLRHLPHLLHLLR